VPTSRERLEERRWDLARLLARLRGDVTLSYSAWEAAEARMVAPAAEMLQALRLVTRNPTADYEDLHETLQPRASAVPRNGTMLDDADVWLAALVKEGVMLSGTDVVRHAYPGLDRGLRAQQALSEPAFTAYQGNIRARPDLDPRTHPSLALSAKRLETLGSCPLRYMLRYVLGVRPPEEADLVPDRWLPPLERGRLLHSVFHRALRQARDHNIEVSDGGFQDIAMRALDFELETWRGRLPPPGDAVFTIECNALRDDVTAFVRMTRTFGAPWKELEFRFGQGLNSQSDAVRIELPGGVIRITGAIDRIDEAADGLVVIDYKTGSAESYGRPMATFHGGRRLQHALYSAVARRLVGNVARAEYHFPTHRGETRIRSFEERALRPARKLIDVLLEWAARGHFFPTENPEDCRYCDYRAVCRVREGNGRTHSPMAEWTARSDSPALALLHEVRRR
jgi:ATP-dependent helicase/nuclease subunit B